MTTLLTLHSGLLNTAWIFFLIVGIWGVFRAIRGLGVDGGYWGAVAVGQLIFVAHAVLVASLLFGGLSASLEQPGIHLLYGAFALVFLPFIYLVALGGDDSNRGQWVMAFSTLFMFGIALRMITTGQG
ncbi:MAG: hypothetical protein AAF633_14195 [Chloroflexota bacterium]